MKSKLPTIVLIFLGILTINSQTTETYQINWALGVNGPAASKTIEVGDTVEWVWSDSGTHNVASKPGSAETFDSNLQSGVGYVYPYTFTVVGTNDYQCDPHFQSMYGTITVVEEGTLSTDEFSISQFSISPNPVTTAIYLKSINDIEIKSISIFNYIGQKVYSSNTVKNSINVAHLSKGMYFLNLKSSSANHTKKFLKL
ncbi:T9SS type A sorting domain-containing protein [Flavobacteriaceae bacterium GSB9]|nr:T9SS type A sorting domain-containing protein [Flavobacteriaceae bacterium GSB9]